MTIGFEAQRIFRNHKHGMDFVALEMIRALQLLDKENQYVVFTNEGPDKDCLKESDNLKIISFKASFPVWEQILLPKYAKKYGCDILHCTSNTAPVFCKVPIVITLHDIIYLESNSLFAKGYSPYQRFGNFYRRIVVKLNLQRVEKIVTVSNFEKRRLVDFLNLSEESVEVVYNGVGDHFFEIHEKEELGRIARKYNLPDKYLLFLGNTDPKKNTGNTILAYARYAEKSKNNLQLVVADLNEEVIKDTLKVEGLSTVIDKIHDTGYIDNKDLPAVLKQSEIFLYPSKRESFGIPILEAMACGTPVITSDVASMPEVAAGAAHLVNPLEIDSIKKAIEDITHQNSKKEQFVLLGKKRASEFRWSNSAKQMLQIYRTILS